jgi:hypothetical protein
MDKLISEVKAGNRIFTRGFIPAFDIVPGFCQEDAARSHCEGQP